MFRAMISLIFRSTILCVTACGIMHPRCCRSLAWKEGRVLYRFADSLWAEANAPAHKLSANLNDTLPPLPGYGPATSWLPYTKSCNTQSSAPEGGQIHRPKHVELIWITNKPSLLPLVGCLYYLHQWWTVKQISNVFVSITWVLYLVILHGINNVNVIFSHVLCTRIFIWLV